MRERAEQVGGTFTATPTVNGGTVTARLPLLPDGPQPTTKAPPPTSATPPHRLWTTFTQSHHDRRVGWQVEDELVNRNIAAFLDDLDKGDVGADYSQRRRDRTQRPGRLDNQTCISSTCVASGGHSLGSMCRSVSAEASHTAQRTLDVHAQGGATYLAVAARRHRTWARFRNRSCTGPSPCRRDRQRRVLSGSAGSVRGSGGGGGYEQGTYRHNHRGAGGDHLGHRHLAAD